MFSLSNILLIVTVILVAILSPSCFLRTVSEKFDEAREKELDGLINKSEKLKAAADVCGQIGAIQKFQLVERSLAKDGSELYFYFKSEKPFLAASEDFSEFFTENGWRMLEQSRRAKHEFYRKDDLRVNIQYGGIRDAEYGVTCAKSNTPSG